MLVSPGGPPGPEAESPRVTCTVVNADGEVVEQVVVRVGKPMLNVMVGRSDRSVDVGCRSGGCGVCRVRVIDGPYTTKRMSARFVTADQAADGYALACRLFPDGDITVTADPVPGAVGPGRSRLS